jgi:4'-phosphopantetheinyl transferase
MRVQSGLETAPRGVDLVLARLDRGPLAVEKALWLLGEEERARAARFVVERERARFIVARATLRRLLGERLGVSPRAVRLARAPHGKPALAGPSGASGLRFNVSHSEDVALFAFARGREIGVDVEAVRSIEDADSIAGRFFSPSEREAFFSLAAAERQLAFFRCWTRKEAFVKAIGDGLAHPLHAFDVSLAPREPARLLRVGNRRGDEAGWTLHAFDPAPGFVGACVVQAG